MVFDTDTFYVVYAGILSEASPLNILIREVTGMCHQIVVDCDSSLKSSSPKFSEPRLFSYVMTVS